MSDFATIATAPVWESELPDVVRYFRNNAWAEAKGDKGCAAFVLAIRDTSEALLRDQVCSICLNLSRALPPDIDLILALIHESDFGIERFSVREMMAEGVAYAKAIREQQTEDAKVQAVRATSIARDEAEAGPAPGLDSFLKGME